MPPRQAPGARRRGRATRLRRHALALSAALVVTLALAVGGCTGRQDAAPEPSTTSVPASPTSAPPTTEPLPAPAASTPPLAEIDWVELVPPTEARLQIRALTSDRALFTVETEHGTRVVDERSDGSRSEFTVGETYTVQSTDRTSSGIVFSTRDTADEGRLQIWRRSPSGKHADLLWTTGQGWESVSTPVAQGDRVYLSRTKGRTSCISSLEADAVPGTTPRDVQCTHGKSQVWWLTAAADGTLSYLVSEDGSDSACASVFRIGPDESVTPAEQLPCANRGWADSSFAAWTDPPAVGAGGADWFRAELHADVGARVLDLGLAAAGSAVRCGDRLAWQATVERGRDQVRVWDPTHGTVVAYQSPLHDGYYTTVVGAILCANGSFVFPTLDADTNLLTYYAETSLGWTLDDQPRPGAA